MSIKYTFIHPTKTGGTACEVYFSNHYNQYIVGTGHEHVCSNNNNPIIVIRDVMDRFISMFNYWKNGAIDTAYKREPEFINKYKNYNIRDFIQLLKNNKRTDLDHKFTWDAHFKPQTFWIKDTDYRKIIIIRYDRNLSPKINSLINSLDIPNKNIELPVINKSKSVDSKFLLTSEDVEFVRKYFRKDYELWNKIENYPELFKLVL
ncbi:MAG: sulfotransferase family 2 domain-containing protein [archaeon]